MNEVGEGDEVLKSLTAVAVETAYQEAACLGRAFTDNFLKIKRIVQDQPTYRAQMEIFTAFTAELLLPDQVVKGLEDLIEWKKED
jgi:hypothetical protein